MAEQKDITLEKTIKNQKLDDEVNNDVCADHISRTRVLKVINSTMAKYEGKVVLAMSEVRDIIKAITTAVNE